MNNILENVPSHLAEELIEKLVETPVVRIERIVSTGHATPESFWYDQEDREWVILLRGAARLTFEEDGNTVELNPGDYVDIAPHRKHRVEWTSPDEPTVWLAVFFRQP